MDEMIGGAVAVAIVAYIVAMILTIIAYVAVILGILALVGFAVYWLARLASEFGDRLLAPGMVRLSIRRTSRQLDKEMAATTAAMEEIAFSSTVLPLSDAEQTLSIFALDDEVEQTDAA